ncbi:hypothetical protein [Wukongibacter sp. M2B1]|uniref:hypothetical protein n=1 Tax=Wukongibacter sp. M2B1 TaxID=3088895 RepID=UPI003D79EF8A
MKKSSWKMKFGLGLIILSAIIYIIHYMTFKDAHHIFVFLLEDIAFIPIEVLIVSLILHRILEEREKQHMLEKLNMLIGVFFNEAGTKLLKTLVMSDSRPDYICSFFRDIQDWNDSDFKNKSKLLNEEFQYDIDIDKVDIGKFANLLRSKREFLLGLLQNPSLLEHETFTELLTAVFHLEDELHHHTNYDDLTKEDYEHLKGDIERVYPLLVREWIVYIKYIKNNYPYLFSLAMRYNPLLEKCNM